MYGTSVSDDQEKKQKRKRMSWKGLGAAPWLVDRLDALNYTFPTTIQINTMEAVNQILNSTEEMVESTSLEERLMISTLSSTSGSGGSGDDGGDNNKDLGIVVSGSTGSGKTRKS
jgi:superfamily II DNA/RNA helicase